MVILIGTFLPLMVFGLPVPGASLPFVLISGTAIADAAGLGTIEPAASVLFIVTAASVFAWLLTTTQAAQALTDGILKNGCSC